MNARINALNAAGGVNGVKVVLDACDEKGDPNKAQDCARKFVSEKAVAVVGDISLFGAQYTPILQQAGIPRLGCYAVSAAELISPDSYPISGGAIIMMEGAMLNAKRNGAKSLFVLTLPVEGSEAMQTLLQNYAKQIGLEWKGQAKIPQTAADVSSYVTLANKSGADTVLVTFGATQTEQVLQSAVQLGSKWHLASLADVLIDKEVIKSAGNSDFATGAYLASAYPPVTDNDVPAVKQYNAEMDAQQASGDQNAVASKRGPVFPEWLAAYAFGQIAKTITGPITAESVTKALNTVKDVDLGGAIPPWTPSSGRGMLARVSNPYGWFVKVDAQGNETLADPQAVDIMNAKG
jgi:ABC-type branched-subunit amino acid transport system substrate-binding protein